MPDPASTARCADFPDWVILYTRASVSHHNANATTARSVTSSGHPISVTFELVDPPGLSRCVVDCPDLTPGDTRSPPCVTGADGAFLLIRVMFPKCRSPTDVFLYGAGPGAAPSLRLLPRPYPQTKVLNVGGGSLAWVDLRRGSGCVRPIRDVTCTNGYIRFIEMEDVDDDDDSDTATMQCRWRATVFKTTTNSWNWERCCTVHSDGLSPADSCLPQLFPEIWNKEEKTLTLEKVISNFPILDMFHDDVVYMTSQLDVQDPNGWVLAVDTRNNKLDRAWGLQDYDAHWWIFEGIADFVRLKAGHVPAHQVQPGQGSCWDKGYDVTARFLWTTATRSAPASSRCSKLNAKLKDGYSNN
ncbi:hypothetical protein EJB05_57204, partial [Eragrostis curvula]